MSSSVYHLQAPFGAHTPFPQPITALAFDPMSDTLWSGNTSGVVNAFHGSNRMRGVSYVVARGDPIKKIIASESVVHAAAGSNVGSWGKGGINKWSHQVPTRSTITFEHHPTKPHTLVLAHTTPEFVLLNSTTGATIRTMKSPSVLSALRGSHSVLLSGAADGYLRIHDVRMAGNRADSDAVETSTLAHVGGVSAVDIGSNTAMSIGWSLRQSRPHPDVLVKLFDLRMSLRPLPPVPFTNGPAFINVHPKKPSLLTVTSAQGLIHIVDTARPNDGGEFHQLDVNSYLTATAISSDGSYIAFGDADGTIHVLSSTADEEHVPFNGFEGKPIEWPDAPDPLPDIVWTDRTPLNTIGMPYYDEPLLSYYEPPLLPASTEVLPPQKIPPQVLASVRTQENVQYAVLPKELRGRRNVVKASSGQKFEGRFRSNLGRRGDTEPQSPGALDTSHPEIPMPYHRVSIKYSKFGVEDFDFGYYNTTSYTGLETDIPNSYSNSLIQLLHYCLPIRNVATSHITTSCRTEHCLLCEFGFVARMIQDASGTNNNLQARNFCFTIGYKERARSFGLVDESLDGENADYAGMIQQLNRFMLEGFVTEGNEFPNNPALVPFPPDISQPAYAAAPITQLLGFDAKNVAICSMCGFKRDKELMSHVIDLVYPRRPAALQDHQSAALFDFRMILRTSLEREVIYKAICSVCKNNANHHSRRELTSDLMPPVLAINAAVNNEEHMKFWLDYGKSRFLQPSVTIPMPQLADGTSKTEDSVTYRLRGYVAEIRMGSVRHLVAVVNTKPPSNSPNDSGYEPGGWYLFNDFVVRKLTEDEALSFPGHWKVPCVVYLERTDRVEALDYSALPQKIPPEILSQKTSMALRVDWNAVKQEVLAPMEIPTPGTLIAIDAEFVSLQQEEAEIRSDGTKRIIKPSQMILARVSVVRGDGPKKGVPFIDDYIHTSEKIVDYLTEFSGIRPVDLDPNYSTNVLLPLKAVYKKLRLLVDLGCIFVGHGLKKDFRTINIFIPPEQVMDTVDIYYMQERGSRRLNLRFLSHVILKEDIQIDVHDSIEDAVAALELYSRFQSDSQADFIKLLNLVYAEGKKLNWKAPERPKPTPAPPVPQTAGLALPMSQPQFQPSLSFRPPPPNAFLPPGVLPFPGAPMRPPWGGPSR